jgi:exonuclease-1
MGIQGLLPVLRSITETVDVSRYAGLTVGVDALCWLHRGVYGEWRDGLHRRWQFAAV